MATSPVHRLWAFCSRCMMLVCRPQPHTAARSGPVSAFLLQQVHKGLHCLSCTCRSSNRFWVCAKLCRLSSSGRRPLSSAWRLFGGSAPSPFGTAWLRHQQTLCTDALRWPHAPPRLPGMYTTGRGLFIGVCARVGMYGISDLMTWTPLLKQPSTAVSVNSMMLSGKGLSPPGRVSLPILGHAPVICCLGCVHTTLGSLVLQVFPRLLSSDSLLQTDVCERC